MDTRCTPILVLSALTYMVWALSLPAYSQAKEISEVRTDPPDQAWSPRVYDPQREPVEVYDYGYAHYFDQGNAYDPYYEEQDVLTSDREIFHRTYRMLDLNPFVNGERVSIQVNNGTVSLNGYVENLEEMMDVVEMAYDAGAVHVKNNLRLREPSELQTGQER